MWITDVSLKTCFLICWHLNKIYPFEYMSHLVIITIPELCNLCNLLNSLLYFPQWFGPSTSNNQDHGDQENPHRIHEEVQGSQMGDVFQMLRGLAEVPSDPAGDGAFPQALVLGGLGQRLRLQRLVHAEADQEQSHPSDCPTAVLRGQTADVGGKVQPETAVRGRRSGSRRRTSCRCCTDHRWANCDLYSAGDGFTN